MINRFFEDKGYTFEMFEPNDTFESYYINLKHTLKVEENYLPVIFRYKIGIFKMCAYGPRKEEECSKMSEVAILRWICAVINNKRYCMF